MKAMKYFENSAAYHWRLENVFDLRKQGLGRRHPGSSLAGAIQLAWRRMGVEGRVAGCLCHIGANVSLLKNVNIIV